MRHAGMSDLAFAIRPTAPCRATLEFDTAIARMATVTAPLGQERVALADAAGRILARPVLARLDSPRADLAAMDGYAVCGEQGARLKIVGGSFPARPFRGAIGPGEAVRIFTGAPIPDGADRVIAQELAVRHGDEVAIPAAKGRRHVRARGSDFAAGAPLLSAGRRLDARAMLVAAAADAATLTLWRQPRVFILATGDELSPPGLASGGALSIPDSTSLAIAALATEWGATITGMALVPDDSDMIEARAKAAMAEADILIVTGGASVGDRDFSRDALGALGLGQVFAGVAIKPGKPVWYGQVGGTQVLGLPGNPTAALVTARLFLAPLLCLLSGRQAGAALGWRPAVLGAPVGEAGSRESFLCGDWDGITVRALDRQAASSQANLASTNVLIRRGRDAPAEPAGATAMILDF
jgi:molybdopterin molybdotransferase